LHSDIEKLLDSAAKYNDDAVTLMKIIVPEFKVANSSYEFLDKAFTV
jgi:hypothetical protein